MENKTNKELVEAECLSCKYIWKTIKKVNYRDERCPKCKCRHKLIKDK